MKETPFERKSCYDCGHLIAKVSWWCGSKDAINARGTAIPGCIHCPFWKPDWSMIDKKYKTAENGYIPKVNRFKEWFSKLFLLMIFLSSCAMIDRTPRYTYNFRVIEGHANYFADDMLYYPGDTVVFFPSKNKIVITDVKLTPR